MLRNLKNSVLSLGVKLDGPEFVKELRDQSHTIAALEKIKEGVESESIIKDIDRDIMFIRAGDIGEKNVEFELKHSYVPMYCLHDINLEHNGLKAQFDFILVTNKCLVVLETKKLNGNIEIRNNGDFIRTLKNHKGKTIKTEGMYSPITQNERHVELLTRLLKDNNIIKRTPIHSLVVMANSKSILNHKYASKTIKNQIVKSDQLKTKLNGYLKEKSDINNPILTMKEIAEFILSNTKETENTFVTKYEKYQYDVLKTSDKNVDSIVNKSSSDSKLLTQKKNEILKSIKSKEVLEKELKEYRLLTSREEKIKAYYIFNNAQMDEIISLYPKTKDDLLQLKGFGPAKIEKYGQAIVDVFL